MLVGMGHGVEGHARAASDLDARTAKSVATTMQALSTPSRLMILGRLRRGPATVGQLSQDVAMEQSAVSHQLRLLRNLGLVEGERRGRSIVYALYDDHVAELLDQAVFHSEHLRWGAVDRPSEPSEPSAAG
jgi:ArsR family transcriptional regulator, nickel/cobalt-responsive transcriptional repressor